MRKKSSHFRTSSSLNMAVRGGIDSLRSPCGQPTHCVRGLSNWLRQLSNPGRGFSSPLECNMRKKKLALSYELFFEYGGEGGD
ncbi:ybl54 [Escherichia coli]|nr:ybl54 [Escherichia coli]